MLQPLIYVIFVHCLFGVLGQQCPLRNCLNQCEYGFDSDANGCPVCNCRLNPSLAPPNSYRSGSCPPIYSTAPTGACPSTCEADTQCGTSQKCCNNGFCNSCQAITTVGPQTGGTRPGVCPAVLPGQVGSCANECTFDTDCFLPNQKCCSNGCGRSCTNVASTTGVATVKPGVCPVLPPSQFGVCVSQCTSDGECPANQKCCSTTCGTVCANPIIGYPAYPTYPGYPTAGGYPVGYPTGYPYQYPLGTNYPGYPVGNYPGYPVGNYPGYPYPGIYPRYSPVIPNNLLFPRFAAVQDEKEQTEFNNENGNGDGNSDGNVDVYLRREENPLD